MWIVTSSSWHGPPTVTVAHGSLSLLQCGRVFCSGAVAVTVYLYKTINAKCTVKHESYWNTGYAAVTYDEP